MKVSLIVIGIVGGLVALLVFGVNPPRDLFMVPIKSPQSVTLGYAEDGKSIFLEFDNHLLNSEKDEFQLNVSLMTLKTKDFFEMELFLDDVHVQDSLNLKVNISGFDHWNIGFKYPIDTTSAEWIMMSEFCEIIPKESIEPKGGFENTLLSGLSGNSSNFKIQVKDGRAEDLVQHLFRTVKQGKDSISFTKIKLWNQNTAMFSSSEAYPEYATFSPQFITSLGGNRPPHNWVSHLYLPELSLGKSSVIDSSLTPLKFKTHTGYDNNEYYSFEKSYWKELEE